MGIDLEVHVDDQAMEDGSDVGGNTTNDEDTHVEDEACMDFPMADLVYTGRFTNLEPCKGMEFDSRDEAYSFYKEYARSVGFTAIRKNSRRSRKTGEFIDANFACTRHGSKRLRAEAIRRRQCYKIDCKASLHVKRRQDGKWVIHDHLKEHNHDLLPAQSHHFRSTKSVDPIRSENIDILRVVGVQTICAVTSKQCDGHQNVDCVEGESMNQIGRESCLAIEGGDAQAILEYCLHMQVENPNFFYAIDLNGDNRLRNVFWVDAKGRHDYVNFNDVVYFDTTYLSNRYKIPLISFIGVNHHFQPILFGCALTTDETSSTLVWLMQTWLKAMGGVTPRVIVTDQDQAIKTAIAEVFPNACQEFCLWSILKKIPEKLGRINERYENFMAEFNKCIYRSWTVDEFENQWWKMVHVFGLSEDVWIRSLYEDRKQWVPTYVRKSFSAGISTDQQSERISSFLDKYVNNNTTLKEFVEQYKVLLQDRHEEESKADFNTWHGTPALKSYSPYEKQMSKIYTYEIFKKFQIEVLGIIACHPKQEKDDGPTLTYRVHDYEAQQEFCVVWDEKNSEISCVCRLFEYKGFLCRHAMIVLQLSAVSEIPSRYILKRWMKDATSRDTVEEKSEELLSRAQRYNNLCQRAFKLSVSQESYNIALQALEGSLKQCPFVNNPVRSALKEATPKVIGPVTNSKGAPKGMKSGSDKKRKRSNTNINGKEQANSRLLIPTRDGYYGSQQSIQELGQLNLTPTLHNGYNGTQHNLPGMDHRAPQQKDINHINVLNQPFCDGSTSWIPSKLGYLENVGNGIHSSQGV